MPTPSGRTPHAERYTLSELPRAEELDEVSAFNLDLVICFIIIRSRTKREVSALGALTEMAASAQVQPAGRGCDGS